VLCPLLVVTVRPGEVPVGVLVSAAGKHRRLVESLRYQGAIPWRSARGGG
jgi:hypothetical protein